LPSWCDPAAQLGVSRGTVRVAYARLIAEQFAIGLGPAGTRGISPGMKWSEQHTAFTGTRMHRLRHRGK
jgi:hypothetical protein